MKLLGLFITYILFPLLCVLSAAVLLVLNKKNDALGNRQLIIFILLCSLVTGIPGVLTFTGISFMPGFYFFIQLTFLILGFFYAEKMENYFSTGSIIANKLMMLLCTLVIVATGSYLFTLSFNFFGDFQYGFMASTATWTLIIPVFFKWSYNALLNIPAEIYKVWKYDPSFKEPVFTSDTIEQIVVLEIELSKKPNDSEYVKVKAKAPFNFNFGEWFQMFILNYNVKYPESCIEYSDPGGHMYSWIFYLKPTLTRGKRYIDYEKSIEDNGLTKDSLTIICKRVDNNFP